MTSCGLEIHARHQLDGACAAAAKLGPAVEQLRWQCVWLASKDPLGAGVYAHGPDFLRRKQFDGLEREILAFDILAPEQVLVPKV
jgi:hypothetical protein